MTILEFIRKNSLLVLIVIVGVGAGLVMMDYSGKGSAFSRDFYIKVNGTGYNYPETASLGENGKEFLGSLMHAVRQQVEAFDADGDGQFNEQEQAAQSEWMKAHPEVEAFYKHLNNLYAAWTYGAADEDAVNVAINRAMLKAEADTLGLHPSEAQIDAFLRSMPAFMKVDGSFNKELYQQLAGYRNGTPNRVQEEMFRDVIADMMIWESLQSLISSGVHYSNKTQTAQLNAFAQSVRGRTAWLAADKVPAPADPTEEELKAYWEEHKDAYKSLERRIISVYTLTPGAESNMENLLYTADALMQDLSQANGQGLDKLLADAANNAEYDPFTYLQADGSTHTTYPLSTMEQLKEVVKDVVNYDGEETSLARVAFTEVADAPTVEAYEAAAAAGNAESNVTIKQLRGFYNTPDDKLKLVRIEAVEPPAVLPYEQARERALVDFRAVRALHALEIAADKLYADMQKVIPEKGLSGAFELAAEAGAQVEMYGPLSLQQPTGSALPSGVSDADILGTPSGRLAPLAMLKGGARITSVDERTVEDSPAINVRRRMIDLPMQNAYLRYSMMQEWLNAAYTRFNVQLSQQVRTRGSH